MVGAEYEFIANIKGPKGDDGGPGPQGTQGVPGPTGQPGTNGVPTDAAVATNVATSTTATGGAVRTVISTQIARVDIRTFIQPGEVLDTTGLAANNTAIIQRAVDSCNTSFVADGKPRQIFFPDGIYQLADAGFIAGSDKSRYAVRWRSGVGIATSSRRGVIFNAPATSSAFVAAVNEYWMYLTNVYCDPHVVDGYKQTSATYSAQFKGWFIQGLADSYFDDVCVRNTFSSGYGCDYIQRTRITGEADNCGRGIKELGIDPLTTSGGSGFGIGTGMFEVENFDLDVLARNCGFHGVFIETQEGGNRPYLRSKGGRVRARVEGNYVGFRDCGSDGLQADIIARKNVYAEILHDKTILNSIVGANGVVHIDAADGLGAGIIFGAGTGKGFYKFIGSIRGMAGAGVTTRDDSFMPPRVTLDLEISDCLGDAVKIDKRSDRLTLKIREWSNTGSGLRITGGGTSSFMTFAECDISGAMVVAQTLIAPLVSSTSRGVSVTGTSPYFADMLDSGPSGGTDLNGRVASAGSANGTWVVSSAGSGTAGLSVYAAGTKSRQVSGTGGTATGLLTAPTRATKISAYAPYIKTGATGYWGIVFRYKDSTNYWVFRTTGQAATWDLIRVVAGVATTLLTSTTAVKQAEGITIADTGTVITVYRDGTVMGSPVTDSANNDGLKAGIRAIAADTSTAFQAFSLFT